MLWKVVFGVFLMVLAYLADGFNVNGNGKRIEAAEPKAYEDNTQYCAFDKGCDIEKQYCFRTAAYLVGFSFGRIVSESYLLHP
jgi:hypothetical protein